MKKELPALLLVMALMLGLLAGCGGTEAREAASAPASQSEAEVSEAPTQAPPAPEETEALPASEGDSALEASAQEPEAVDDGIRRYITPDNIEELIAGRPALPLPLTQDGDSISFWTGSPSMDATISGWNLWRPLSP